MQNDLTVCDGPGAAPIGRGRSRPRSVIHRGLLALPLVLLLIAPGTAVAVEATTGYSQTTPPPKTQTTPAPKTETKAEQGTGPSQTSSTPSKETKPAKASSEPTATTATKAKTLPFTGLDLRWVTIGGLLLIGMGMSIMAVQRGRHGNRRSARPKLPS
jgi:hypothetical protein